MRGRLMPRRAIATRSRACAKRLAQQGKPHFQEFLAAWQEQPG